MDKKVLKLLSETINNANIIQCNISIEELTEKYNNILAEYGEEKALQALQNTYKSLKEKASEKEKLFWNSVKNEVFKKLKSCPCSTRDLKSMIKSGQIDITGFTNEIEIRTLLSI